MYLKLILGMIGAPLFLVSIGTHFFVKWRLRGGYDSDLDEYYYELEEQHPGYAKYLKWSRITFGGMVVSAIMLFVAIAI